MESFLWSFFAELAMATSPGIVIIWGRCGLQRYIRKTEQPICILQCEFGPE